MRAISVRCNWLSQFAMSFCFAVTTVLLLAVVVRPSQNTTTIELLCGGGVILCSYLSIGAFINGKRQMVAWFKVKFGWGH